MWGFGMTEKIPLFVVYDKTTEHIYEKGFSEEAMEYYASKRENCAVGVIMIDEFELEVI